MAQYDTALIDRTITGKWSTGIVSGLLSALVTGLIIHFGFNPLVLSEGVPAAIGMSGLVVGWILFLIIGAVLGLLYAGIATRSIFATYTPYPGTGAIVGLGFGLVVWGIGAVVVPLLLGTPGTEFGQYALTTSGVLSYALFGLLIGLGYGVSPYTA